MGQAMLNESAPINKDVVIIGAGPAGATLALILAKHYDIKPLVISRHKGTANTPRAHIFNQRAMEVMRDVGLEQQLSYVASAATEMQHTSWSHTLNGREYGRLWSWGNDPARRGTYEASSPCQMTDLPQSYLEPVLVKESQQLGVEYQFNTEFVSFKQTDDQVRTCIRNRESGTCSVVISKFLVGADGARSAVLDELGIPVDGCRLNDAFNVHIKADLSRYFEHRPGSLNWVLNPDAPEWSAVGNFRMVRPWNEFVVSMHPSAKEGKPFEPSSDDIRRRLYQMIGEKEVGIEILSAYKWTINDQIARSWQKGRVICIGDATHRHPPINGLGSNTYISDAFNVAWKLGYVLKGWASPRLLETLTDERKPVGDRIVRRANAGMEVHRKLWGILGLTQEARETAVQTLESDTCEGTLLRKDLRQTLELVDDEVQAIGIQMNQVYLNSRATMAELDDHPPDFSHSNELKDVFLSTFPGYHLPHLWLARDGHSPKVSTLDLAGHGYFLLLTREAGGKWLKAVETVLETRQIPIKACSIGFGCDYMDAYRGWSKICDVEDDGAVLVRPDHFVAWRCHSLQSGHVGKLQEVLGHCLGYD
ncbi:hypothetical protein H2198_006487 [Neophaeococcomyces mojaviensis]|uniref:Uncharacterized protein n=1 Tax=Neophaeococcomyces mojaviensis TaxID=3383035 RepID=A0ACC3A396_9EURO|nr:hypothetical protein H2198_006487 [Knufia sp. JES_112]